MTIHWETVSAGMRQVMLGFGCSAFGASFYLAGGTAPALQLGHRRSSDLDFFSPNLDLPSLRQQLAAALEGFNPILADTSWGNLVFLAGGVRIGFFGYGYPMMAPFVDADGVRLAGIADIALMKLDALLGRASRKDFYDLYALCQYLSLREIMALAPLKYPAVRDFETQAVKRLVYFERAEQEEPPVLLQEISWKTVKAYFRGQAAAIGKSWIG
jgi:hypothetical protein